MSARETFDLAVVIGRFQPFHLGHAALLARALNIAEQVVVVLGSCGHARNAKNPFKANERQAMIGATLDDASRARVRFVPLRDYYDDARWQAAVHEAVAAPHGSRVALVGFRKDASSHYLDRFPGWALVAVPAVPELDASAIRRVYFEGEDAAAREALLATLLPNPVAHYLKGWALLPAYAEMREEHLAVEDSVRQWGHGPFVTVDSVVTAADHVLLIRRGQAPGKGLWALPGGYLELRERLLQGAMRELREETGLALLDSVLEAALKGVAVFDHPDRSQRGRVITHAHWFDLGESRLPEVLGADDAAEAHWLPLADLDALEEVLFDDHFLILRHFLSV